MSANQSTKLSSVLLSVACALFLVFVIMCFEYKDVLTVASVKASEVRSICGEVERITPPAVGPEGPTLLVLKFKDFGAPVSFLGKVEGAKITRGEKYQIFQEEKGGVVNVSWVEHCHY